MLRRSAQKTSRKFAHPVTRPATSRIYQSGRDNFFDVRFKSGGPHEVVAPANVRIVPPMAVIALVTVGLLGDGFMLYALFHWMRDDARRRK
jgi:hypothetical protein